MGLVLNGRDKGKGAPVHVDGNFPPLAVHDGTGTVVVVLHHAVERHICKGSPGECIFCRAHLPPAAVHQKQIRPLPEPVAAWLPIFCKLCVLFILCRPPGDGLCQRCIVVSARHRFHLESAVARLIRLTILEGHHAADAGAIAPVGDIVTLNSPGRLCKAQHLRQLVQQFFLPGVTAALPGKALHRVGVGHLHQMGLIAPLGHIQLHLTAALFVQRLLQSVAVRRQLVHRNDLGDLLVIQIIPGQKFLPHSGDIRGIVEQKLPLVGQPSVPEAQHRRTHAVRRACQRHHVHLHIRVHNDLLSGAHLGDGCDLVPQQGRCLKFQPVRGLLHPLVKDLQDVLFAVADQVHSILDRLVVGLAADLSAAHCHALTDVRIQAGASPADLLREALIAARQQKGIHGRFRHLPGRKAGGIGADILGIVLLLLQHEGEPGP